MPKFATFPAESDIPVLSEVSDRVEYIADLMESLVWKRGKSAKVLAKVWGLAKGTVESNAAEASRMITADAEQVRRNISIMGEKLLMDAHRGGKAKDFSLLGKLLAEISGANAPIKQDIQITDDASPARARELLGGAFRGSVGKHVSEAENEAGAASEPSTDEESSDG